MPGEQQARNKNRLPQINLHPVLAHRVALAAPGPHLPASLPAPAPCRRAGIQHRSVAFCSALAALCLRPPAPATARRPAPRPPTAARYRYVALHSKRTLHSERTLNRPLAASSARIHRSRRLPSQSFPIPTLLLPIHPYSPPAPAVFARVRNARRRFGGFIEEGAGVPGMGRGGGGEEGRGGGGDGAGQEERRVSPEAEALKAKLKEHVFLQELAAY